MPSLMTYYRSRKRRPQQEQNFQHLRLPCMQYSTVTREPSQSARKNLTAINKDPVMVSPKYESLDEEREEWAQLSLQSLGRAYADDEPDYSLDLIKTANLEYEEK